MSCPILYTVSLTEKEKTKVNEVIKDNLFSSFLCKRALILLALDNKNTSNLSYKQISSVLNTSTATVSKVAREYFLYGLEYVLFRRFDKPSNKNISYNTGRKEIVVKVTCEINSKHRDSWCVEVDINN